MYNEKCVWFFDCYLRWEYYFEVFWLCIDYFKFIVFGGILVFFLFIRLLYYFFLCD